MGRFVLLIVGVALAGCAPDFTFRHPVSGDVKVCGGLPDRGPLARSAQQMQADCQDDLYRKGYERVPNS